MFVLTAQFTNLIPASVELSNALPITWNGVIDSPVATALAQPFTVEVTKGQRLVTSSVKGCARAVAAGESISPFNVIGRALESSTDAGIKLVNCAVRTNN